MQAVKFAANTLNLYVKSLINIVYCVCVVLKAGERMLTTKINTQVATRLSLWSPSIFFVTTCYTTYMYTQQKRLNTVLHAMEDHRRRQSQFFKFEAPDSVVCIMDNYNANDPCQRIHGNTCRGWLWKHMVWVGTMWLPINRYGRNNV